jgi:hypothetical protein
MTRVPHWLVLALILIACGTALIFWKVNVYGFPLQPDAADESWTVQARLELVPGNGPIKAALSLPSQTPGLGRLREDFISRGFGLDVQEEHNRREAIWAVRQASGLQTLYYRGLFYSDPAAQSDFAPPPEKPDMPILEEPFATAMRSIIVDARRQSADAASLTSEILSRINDPSPSLEVRLFLNAPEFQENGLDFLHTLLAGAGIPAMKINGLFLVESEREATLAPWLAVHDGDNWLFFNPETGQQGLPANYLVWWQGTEAPVVLEGAELEDLQWSIRRNQIGAVSLAEVRAKQHGFFLSGFSLLELPLQTQSVYAVLILVPIGAFVTVLMRNLIGVRSFGTFMPVLIALAFRDTGLVGGLVLFSLVVALGLVFRFYLERLQLLLVPRLTAVMTIVITLMAGLSIFSDRLGWEVGLSVGLFPMVILTMVIERMSIVWEERSPWEALIEGLGSVVIAAMAYLVMGSTLVQHLVFVFPETLLILLGLSIMMGRYFGYRLSELVRFQEFTKVGLTRT